MRELGLAVAVALGAVFCSTGVAKFRLGGFARDLAQYQIIPARLVPPVARAIPWLEVAIGAALLLGLESRVALSAAAALLLLFAAAMIVNLVRGRRIDCGCGGVRRPISWPLVIRNLAMAGLALWLIRLAVSPGLRSLLQAPAELSRSDVLATLLTLALLATAARITAAGARLRRAISALAEPNPGASQ